jgi:hypothetical protein
MDLIKIAARVAAPVVTVKSVVMQSRDPDWAGFEVTGTLDGQPFSGIYRQNMVKQDSPDWNHVSGYDLEQVNDDDYPDVFNDIQQSIFQSDAFQHARNLYDPQFQMVEETMEE